MNSDVYKKICEDNKVKYGTEGSTIANFLGDMYSEKTHFIYEIIQNAEDACERAYSKNKKREFKISFYLYPDRFEIRHNGLEFDESDIRGVSSLLRGTKKEDVMQIGKFGIGFKSVYVYTETPRVYSGEHAFEIKGYLFPEGIEQRKDVNQEETLIILPFNHKKTNPKETYAQIKDFLENLNLRSIMFLRHINHIEWHMNGKLSGSISKKVQGTKTHNRLTIINESMFESWIVFEKKISKELSVQVAYKIEKNKKTGKEKVVSCGNSEMFVFLPLGKMETYMNFLMNGPFITTATREGIKDDHPKNVELMKKTAELVSESISEIKSIGLLDVSFLSILPLIRDNFSKGSRGHFFSPIFQAVLDKLSSDEELLPCKGEVYLSSKDCCLASSSAIRALLVSEQINSLFGKKGWLVGDITKDREPQLHNYLLNELKIIEIDHDKFTEKFSAKFAEAQDDEWILKLFEYLDGYINVYRSNYYPSNSILLKPIIRLQDGSHTEPFFESSREQKVYLPSKFENDLPTVKKEICADQRAMQFLKKIGICEVDQFIVISKTILPKYKNKSVECTAEENYRHVLQVVEAMKKAKSVNNTEFIDAVQATHFLLANNAAENKSYYCVPVHVYFGKSYNKDSIIEEFYGNCDGCYLLDSRYHQIGFENLKVLGIDTTPRIWSRAPNYSSEVIIYNYDGLHEKCLDKFDKDAKFDNLGCVLKKISLFRAKKIWDIIIQENHLIKGTVCHATRKDYSNSTEREVYSNFGSLLVGNAWVPDKTGKFHKPCDIQFDELHEDFDTSPRARLVSELLDFKTNEEQKIYDSLPEDDQDILKSYKKLSPQKQKEMLALIKAAERESSKSNASPTAPPATPSSAPVPPEVDDESDENTPKKSLEDLIKERNSRTRQFSDYFGRNLSRVPSSIPPGETPPEDELPDEDPVEDPAEEPAEPSLLPENKGSIKPNIQQDLDNTYREVLSSYGRISNPKSDKVLFKLRDELRSQLKDKIRSIHEGNCQVEGCSFRLATQNNITSEAEVLFFATYYFTSRLREIDMDTELGNVVSLCPNHHFEFRMTVLCPSRTDLPKQEKINENVFRVRLKHTDNSFFDLIYNHEHLSKFKQYFKID